MSTEEEDLRIESFDRFLSRIVSLIPAHLYEHTLSEDAMHSSATDEGSSKYYKHKKQPLAADERKSKSKRKRAEVYGALEEQPEETDDTTVAVAYANPVPESDPVISCNLEELRLKLQEKLINYRLKRTSAKTNRPPETKSGGRSNSNSNGKGNSKGDASKTKAGTSSKKKPAARQPESVAAAAPVEGAGKKGRQGLSEELRSVQQDLQFSNMVLPPPVTQSAPTQGAASGPAAVGNKTQRLQRLLAETEKKRKRLQELSKAATPQDTKQLKNILWNDAIKAAAGEKSVVTGSKDSELKIKKALRKKQKAKEKSAEQWQQRLDAVEEGKQVKAQRREQNLLSRQGKAAAAPAAEADGTGGRDRDRDRNRKQDGGNRSKSHSAGAGGGAGAGGDGNSNGSRKKPRAEQQARNSKDGPALRRPGFEGRFEGFLNHQRKAGPT